MNDWAIDGITILVRSTLVMSLSAVLVLSFLKFFRATSPQLHRLACLAVILQGWLLVQVPMTLPNAFGPFDSPSRSVPSPLEGERIRERGFESREMLAPSPWPSPSPRGRGDRQEDARSDPLPVAAIRAAALQESAIQTTMMQTARFSSPWAVLAVALWGAGIVALLVRSIWAYLSFIRRLPVSLPVSAEWAAEWIDLQRQAGVRRFAPLHVVPEWGPLLCWHPRGTRLIVPAEFWSSLTPVQRRPILLHELAHLVRRDIGKSLVVRLLALPYWFNPLVWRLVKRFDDCAEWACDEAVRSAEADTLADYARTLLQLAESATAPLLATTAAAGGHGLAVRIRRLMDLQPRKDSIMKKLAMVLLMLGLVSTQVVRVQLQAEDESTTAADPTVSKVQASGSVTIRQGSGSSAVELTADRLVLFTDEVDLNLAAVAEPHVEEESVTIITGGTDVIIENSVKRTEAVVDIRRLLNEAKPFQRDRQQFQEDIAQREEAARLAKIELNALRKKYEDLHQRTMDDAALFKAYRTLVREKESQLRSENQATQSELRRKETELQLAQYGQVVAEVSAYAKEQGLRVVRRKNSSSHTVEVVDFDATNTENVIVMTENGSLVKKRVVGFIKQDNKTSKEEQPATPTQLLQKIMEKEIIYAEVDQENDITDEILKRLNDKIDAEHAEK